MSDSAATTPTRSASQYLTLRQAVERLAQMTGVKVSPSTVWRWCVSGTNGARLRFVKLGRRYLTTADWIEEFMAASAGLSVARAADDIREGAPVVWGDDGEVHAIPHPHRIDPRAPLPRRQ